MSKKEPKKVTPKGNDEEKSPPSTELSEDQLEQVSGGAVDSFLKFGGIEGESTDHKHKDLIEYTPVTPLPNKLFKI